MAATTTTTVDDNAREQNGSEEGGGERGTRGNGGRWGRRPAQQTLPNRRKPGYGHHRHDAPSFGTQVTSMGPPGQLCVPVCSSACFSHYFSPRPCLSLFDPFFSSCFLSPFYLFVSLFVSSVLLLCFSLFICFFVWVRFVSLSCFLSASLFFASLVLVVCYYLCSTPLAKRASLKTGVFCAFSRVFPFLNYFFLLLPCLTWTWFVFSAPFPSWMCDFFDFCFDFSTSSCYFHPVYFFPGNNMWSFRLPWRLVQRTACMYLIGTCADLLSFLSGLSQGWVCLGNRVLRFACLFLPRYFFPSRVIGACPASTDCIVL